MVEGKCNPKPVVSWKGVLLGVSSKAYPAWLAEHKPSATASSSPDTVLPSPPPRTPGKPNNGAEKSTQSTDDASSAPWAGWVVMIAAAIGFLGLVLKRRTK